MARGQGERAALPRALSSRAARTEGSRQRNSRVLTGPARHRGHGSASGWKPVSQSHEVARRRELARAECGEVVYSISGVRVATGLKIGLATPNLLKQGAGIRTRMA